MKHFTLLFSFLLLCAMADCQRREKIKKDKFNSAKFNKYEVEISKKWFDNFEFIFPVGFDFVDARADKSKLGFIRAGDANEFSNFVFPQEASSYINSRVNTSPAGSNAKKLLIVIRHLWLSQVIVKSGIIKNILLLDPKGYLSYCYFSGDFYLENGGQLQYLGKIDTVSHFHRWMGNVNTELINKSLAAAMNVGDSLAALASPSVPSFASQQLRDSLSDQFNFAILKTDAPRRGIYMKYEDFLNNAPLEEEFELKEDHDDEHLLAKKTDTSITNKAWGYCDGKNIFKHFNDEYYMMVRVQNTFEVAGPRVIRQAYAPGREFFIIGLNSFFRGLLGGVTTIFVMMSDKNIMHELVPYQLNIRNGTFY